MKLGRKESCNLKAKLPIGTMCLQCATACAHRCEVKLRWRKLRENLQSQEGRSWQLSESWWGLPTHVNLCMCERLEASAYEGVRKGGALTLMGSQHCQSLRSFPTKSDLDQPFAGKASSESTLKLNATKDVQ